MVYKASKRLGGWEPQQKESQVSSPSPHFHCNALAFSPLSIQDSESQETRSHLSNKSYALSCPPAPTIQGKRRTWPLMILPWERERWTLIHQSHIYYVVPSKGRSKTHRKEWGQRDEFSAAKTHLLSASHKFFLSLNFPNSALIQILDTWSLLPSQPRVWSFHQVKLPILHACFNHLQLLESLASNTTRIWRLSCSRTSLSESE